MSALLLAIATHAMRAWTRVYTIGLAPEDRDARLAEIDSDLWESWHDLDRRNARLALEIAIRLIAGVPHDLAWRFGRAALRTPSVPAGAAVATLASLVFSGFVASASGPVIPATEALRVEVVADGWIDGGTVDGRRRIVPAASFRITNIANRPLRALEVNVLFARTATDRSGSVADRYGFGTAWARLDVGGGLRPGASVVTPLLTSLWGYVGVPNAARGDPERFGRLPIGGATVRLFVRCESDRWRRLADFAIGRALVTDAAALKGPPYVRR